MKWLLTLLLFSSFGFCDIFINKCPQDLKSYFRKETFIPLGIGFIVGGIVANSPFDQALQDAYQKNFRTKDGDEFLRFWKRMGQDEVLYAYSVLGAFALAFQPTDAGRFAGTLFTKCARTFIVGTIPLHVMRTLTGGSRPSNTTRSSYWRPLTLPHGVSGHTYTGAILFINWAKMTDNIFLKTALYGASTLTGISRINDECHYPSQVMLGWLMAYVACEAISYTDSNYNVTISADRVSFGFDF